MSKEDLGEKVRKELQKAIDEWTSYIEGGAPGFYEYPETQKIELPKPKKENK